METSFNKKTYLAYVKEYVKKWVSAQEPRHTFYNHIQYFLGTTVNSGLHLFRLKEKVKENEPDRVDKFTESCTVEVKKIMGDFNNFQVDDLISHT